MRFSDKYCRHTGIPAEAYEHVVFERALYPLARTFRGFLGLIPGYFSADLDFIRSVGQLRRRRDFSHEEFEFHQHPDNRHFLRRTLKLRVSAGRLQRIVHAALTEREPAGEIPAPKR